MSANLDELDVPWDDLRYFLLVTRAGSFLAAAERLGVATSTLSRRVAQLERTLGYPLLERRRDGVRPNEAGRALAETAEALADQLGQRLRALSGRGALSGVIRVSAGDGFTDLIAAAAHDFALLHPDVSFELRVEPEFVDLEKGAADVAVRTVRRQEGTLVYRQVGTLAYRLCAARDYQRRHGLPRAVARLPEHRVVGFAPPLHRAGMAPWLRGLGVERFFVRTNTFGGYLAAVRGGLGIGALPEVLMGDLVPVLPRTRPEPQPLFVCAHRDRRKAPHVRAFIEALAARVQAELTRGSAL
ncbi:MAG: LysR family transcriptional regulator [Myxococcales bacterium]|nr:LysR family transcriptional regulator [Myxococcales bacterium]MCB9652051.1 LysR family transcriptional regulator [Deltaproteobacteria bacterium]